MATEAFMSGFARTLFWGSRKLNRKRFWPQVSSPTLAMMNGTIGGVVAGGCQAGRLPGSGAVWQAVPDAPGEAPPRTGWVGLTFWLEHAAASRATAIAATAKGSLRSTATG